MDYEEEYDYKMSDACGEALINFRASYGELHYYIVLVLCLFGSVGNLANVVVLTHRRMRAPIDAIFTALAIAHLVYVLGYIPYSVTMLIRIPRLQQTDGLLGYYSILYEVIGINVNLVMSVIASWLTISIIVWGIIHVAYPYKIRYLCSMRRAIIVSFCAYLFCPILCVPHFLMYKVASGYAIPDADGNTVDHFDDVSDLDLRNATEIHEFAATEIATLHDFLLLEVNNWLMVIVSVVECVAQVVTTALLMYALWRRNRSEIPSAFLMTADDDSDREDEVSMYRTNGDTPSKLIVVMAAVYIILILPVNVRHLVDTYVWLGNEHSDFCHLGFAEFLAMISFIYPAVTCWLYCGLRIEFWDTFVFIFKPRCLERWWPNTGRGRSQGRGWSDDTRVRGSTMTQLTVT